VLRCRFRRLDRSAALADAGSAVLAALQTFFDLGSCSVPVKWSISHEDRMVLASAEGEASLADLEQYISGVIAAGAMPYRKLFDTNYLAPGALRLTEIRAFSRKVLELAKAGPIGPIAIVVGSELEQEMAEAFGEVDAGRPLAIFSDESKARQWLESF
jgi:hypothetical protein